MIVLSRMLLLLSFILFYKQDIQANQQVVKENPSHYLSDKVWEEVQDYLIPDDHPMKEQLDHIFSRSRALLHQKSMIAAGFVPHLQHYTQVTVATHPKLPGYVIKAYLDSTRRGRKERPEEYFLIRRIVGARLVRESIERHHYEHLIKVPEKWLYLLPDKPSPPPYYARRRFILIENDMEIFSEEKNKKLWGSQQATLELLDALYTVATEVGLSDSLKPSNCPFAKDGRIALLDTQSFNNESIKYENLTPYLSSSMKKYWIKLTKSQEKSEK